MGSLRSSAQHHDLGHLATKSLAAFGVTHLVARRDFLRLGATAAGIALAGCSGGTAPRPARTVATGSDFRVGVVLPAAGPGAAIGDSIRAGMRLSFAESGYEAAGRRVVEVAGDEGSGDAA